MESQRTLVPYSTPSLTTSVVSSMDTSSLSECSPSSLQQSPPYGDGPLQYQDEALGEVKARERKTIFIRLLTSIFITVIVSLIVAAVVERIHDHRGEIHHEMPTQSVEKITVASTQAASTSSVAGEATSDAASLSLRCSQHDFRRSRLDKHVGSRGYGEITRVNCRLRLHGAPQRRHTGHQHSTHGGNGQRRQANGGSRTCRAWQSIPSATACGRRRCIDPAGTATLTSLHRSLSRRGAGGNLSIRIEALKGQTATDEKSPQKSPSNEPRT